MQQLTHSLTMHAGGPCKFVAPQFERLSTEFTSVVFAKVDVDEAEDVAAAESIQAMPTFKFYKGGKKVDEIMGADVKKLTALLQQHA